jgi:uncharacterized protein YrrD
MEVVSDEEADSVTSDEEADSIISHGTERVLAFKVKERWHHCQNAWRQQVSCRISDL